LDPNQLFRINKYLYGLPNSGRAFYYHYKSALVQEGYRCSRIDPCLFVKTDNEEKVYIIIHVDDTFVFATNRDHLRKFTDDMNKHFPTTLDTAADSFLGMKISRTAEGDIELSQPKLVDKLLKECNDALRQSRKPITHPYGPSRSHRAEDQDNEPAESKQEVDKGTYLRILGMLMYLTRSRPDILTAVNFCATKASNPDAEDMEHLYSIVKYINDTRSNKYVISRGQHGPKIAIICEVDAGYLSHHDSKSHTGYAIKFSGCRGFFYIRSNKQTTVATSSTHAEMQAVHTLVKDILYILQILEDMEEEVNLPVVIMEDNSAVIQTATGEAAHLKRCKHFLMVINYVREQVEKGYIELRKIKGEDNTSDILTKRVRTKDFREKASKLMGERDET
jgi:desulfoferrodoxin (superoxide reductase-like protein)